MTKGLTQKEWKTFKDMLSMANEEQLTRIQNCSEAEILRRQSMKMGIYA